MDHNPPLADAPNRNYVIIFQFLFATICDKLTGQLLGNLSDI